MPHAALEQVMERIARAARLAGRVPSDITLIAVSKTFGADAIMPVIDAGQTDFGENRVQEAQGKWPALMQRNGGCKLHLIGPLQTNKAADAVTLFDAVHSLDRPKLAAVLAKEMARRQRRLQLFIQVNTGDETQKAGVSLADADRFIDECRDAHRLAIAGLMCIPPVDAPPKPHFELLAGLARRHGLTQLSMGMSGDFEAAIACGATHVRVGSAIFGAR
jgi:pyridoxal phosphate enzyme (YggS family)